MLRERILSALDAGWQVCLIQTLITSARQLGETAVQFQWQELRQQRLRCQAATRRQGIKIAGIAAEGYQDRVGFRLMDRRQGRRIDDVAPAQFFENVLGRLDEFGALLDDCLLYTSPSPRDRTRSRMPSSA